MAGILLLCFCSMLLANTRVFASTEYRLGGNEGNAWQTALTEASFYQVLDTDGQIVRQETVGLSSFGPGADTLIHFSAGSILPRHIEPAVNIAEADVNAGRTAIPLINIPGSRVLNSTGCWAWGNFQHSIKLMLDGDPTTAAFRTFVQKDGALPGVGYTWSSSVVFAFGADVPMCLHGRTCFVGGIGELLDAAPALPECALVLANPGVPVATPNVFRARSGTYSEPARFTKVPKDVDALAELLAARRNDLEDPAKALVPVSNDVLHALRGVPGCRFARMSGSGATCFALFEGEGQASAAAEILRAQHADWWIAPSRLIQPA